MSNGMWDIAGEWASCRLCADGKKFTCSSRNEVMMRWHESWHEKMEARFDDMRKERDSQEELEAKLDMDARLEK